MIQDYLNKKFFYAVVGATTDHSKYGYRVLKDFQAAGLKALGVNPKYNDIEGVACYQSLEHLPRTPDVVVFVVPPSVGMGILSQVKNLGITKVWFQPGAESDDIRKKIAELGLEGMADGSCIMVARRQVGL